MTPVTSPSRFVRRETRPPVTGHQMVSRLIVHAPPPKRYAIAIPSERPPWARNRTSESGYSSQRCWKFRTTSADRARTVGPLLKYIDMRLNPSHTSTRALDDLRARDYP